MNSTQLGPHGALVHPGAHPSALTLSILSAPMGDLVADLDGWNSHSLLWGDWGILGTFRCLSALFWGYHRRPCAPTLTPGDLGRPLKPPPLIADGPHNLGTRSQPTGTLVRGNWRGP